MRPPVYRCRACGVALGILPRAFCRVCADARPNDDPGLSDNPEEEDR